MCLWKGDENRDTWQAVLIKSLSARVRVTGLTYAFTRREMNDPQIKRIHLCSEAATVYRRIKRAGRHTG